MVFKLRMLSDEIDNFERVYEVSYDMDLENFHDFICDDLEYDKSAFSSFFLSNEKWDKLQEYTLIDMADDDGTISLPMKDALLGQLIKSKHDRLIFMFDIFAARSLYVELQEVKEAENGVRYPTVVYAAGGTPPQFDAESIITEDSPFNDIMSEFSYFEGSDDDSIYDDV